MHTDNFTENYFLIVDRDPFTRDNLRRTLLAAGVSNVHVANSASRAIGMCKEVTYDIVIADYDLGYGRNGQQLLEELRNKQWLKNTSAFIIITAQTNRDIVLSTLEFKPEDYLAKPYLEIKLLHRIKRVIAYKYALKNVYHAIDQGDLPEAITLCRKYIINNLKFKEGATRLLAELYLNTQQLSQALDVYEIAVNSFESDWARFGLAKSYREQGNNNKAEELFLQLINNNYMYIEAYENLAVIYKEKEENQKAEDMLSRAILVSPLSVRRQKLYADICEKNNRFETSIKARRQVIRLSRNSKHEAAENYLRLSSALADYCEYNQSEEEELSGEINKTLLTMRKNHRPNHDHETQAMLIEGRMLLNKNVERGLAVIDKAKERYEKRPTTFSNNTKIEFAKSLTIVGETEKAQKILASLVSRCVDIDLMGRVDKILDEPISLRGKKLIVEINRKGIKSFKEKDYDKSVKEFMGALVYFPKNIELNLNLVQVLIKQAEKKQKKQRDTYLKQARSCLNRIDHITTTHKKYQNHRRLCNELTSLEKSK